MAGPGAPAAGGVLVAEGDSWFDYPLDDVLSILERAHQFRIEQDAHKGDTLESMAYDASQFTRLARKFEHLRDDHHPPRAILLSAGGNDIAGDEFAVLINHVKSGLPVVNARVIEGIIDDRLRVALASLIASMTRLSEEYFGRRIPIVIHGYAYVVPDGRGYLGGGWVLPGPWLRPGFRRKGHLELKDNRDVMIYVIDRYNRMLAAVAKEKRFEHVHYLDLRALLSNELPRAYRKSWANELHPTDAGFAVVANAFADLVNRFPPAGEVSAATRRR